MDESWVIDIARQSMQTMLFVGGPLLFIALVVGLIVSVFQALTQINEATLTFIPKIVAIVASLLIIGPWMLRILTSFTTELYSNMNLYLR